MFSTDNQIKKLIEADQVALGIVCRSLSPVVVELIGLSGFDFVWIDMEHTSASFSDVENLCRAAEATGIQTLVRVADKSPSNVLRALEAGAGIVNVPLVENHRDAEAVVQAARYHPDGKRGMCTSSRGNMYGIGGAAGEVLASANKRVLTMVQLESREAVENVGEISKVPGLDAIFVGLGDLAQSLGLHSKDHATVRQYVDRIVESARANGKTIAALADTPQLARAWVDCGARIVCCGVDIEIMRDRLANIGSQFADVRRCHTGS